MMASRDELLFSEQYGNCVKKNVYYLPDEDKFMIGCSKKNIVSNWFIKVFLPEGYPGSVSRDYLKYQIWDTAQAFCSTISGILATQEVLRGVGVGDANATPLAATITWVLRDGCGHIAKIVFAFSHGKLLDAYSKKWRFFADILNNVAMCIEMMLPHFKVYSLGVLCLSTVCRAIVGIAGGATRVAMTQHHAAKNNLADVSAKDAAQETAVNLVASLVSLLIITYFGNNFLIFMLMMVLHILFNYLAVKAVCLRTMNETRFLLAIESYLRFNRLVWPEAINKLEPITFYKPKNCVTDIHICGFKIKLGSSLCDAIKGHLRRDALLELREVYSGKPYIPVVNMRRLTIHIIFKQGASMDDILCSYFHAVMLAYVICAIDGRHELSRVVAKLENPAEYVSLANILECLSWGRIVRNHNGVMVAPPSRPSVQLMRLVNTSVTREWLILRRGLLHRVHRLVCRVVLILQIWLRIAVAGSLAHALTPERMLLAGAGLLDVYTQHSDEIVKFLL